MVRSGQSGLRLIGRADEPVGFSRFRADRDAVAGVDQTYTSYAVTTEPHHGGARIVPARSARLDDADDAQSSLSAATTAVANVISAICHDSEYTSSRRRVVEVDFHGV